MRLVRIILESLLTTALAALVFYPLRHHPVAGLVLVIVVCLLGIVGITLIEKRVAQRKAVSASSGGARAPERSVESRMAWAERSTDRDEGATRQPSDEPDLLVTADGVQIHVRNQGPLAEFSAEIAGVITNGTESEGKHALLSWAYQDEGVPIVIPKDATRTIVLWEPKYDSRIFDTIGDPAGPPPLTRTYVHFFAWADSHFLIGANETFGVRVRFVRTDPPGVTDRIVTIRHIVEGNGGRLPSEVTKP